MTQIHWANVEDQRLILRLHYDTGDVHGVTEPHGGLSGHQASAARRALMGDGLLRPTHGGCGYIITPEGRAKVEEQGKS